MRGDVQTCDAERHARHSSLFYKSPLLILAEGRGSELVRERASIIAENASSEIPSSRTSSLPRPRAEA
ncbi:hypothetical protein GIW45_08065 [Pseudomonas congelans]|nr:hypothetical protein [Pseudomonas congelans]